MKNKNGKEKQRRPNESRKSKSSKKPSWWQRHGKKQACWKEHNEDLKWHLDMAGVYWELSH